MVFQAAADGSIYKGDNPAHPTVVQRRETLERALGSMGWTAKISESKLGGRFVKFNADIRKADMQLSLDIFIFPNLNWGNRPGRLYEKRIQITRPFAEHSQEFQHPQTGPNRCLLLGINRIDENQSVICAWDASSYIDHGASNSCWGDVRGIAEAFKVGFSQTIDRNGRYVCYFKPEFIHYYLANMEALHTPPNQTSLNLIVPVDDDSVDSDEARLTGGDNSILYGAPGTGKSYTLNARVDDAKAVRTVFHPDIQNSRRRSAV